MKKISAKYTASDWPTDLDRYSPDWVKAIDIVRDRFESRYFRPVNDLIESENSDVKYNCGFVVMSIDCLLIEALNQYYFGITHTGEKYYKDRFNPAINDFEQNPNRMYWYGWQAFRDFFKHSVHFEKFTHDPELPHVFYDDIRCGLLHQAESKIHSLINVKKKEMLTYIHPYDCRKGIIINRTLFHTALEKEFHRYLANLGDPESKNIEGDYLRDTCRNKMDTMFAFNKL